jgi:predicted phosphodiesterase
MPKLPQIFVISDIHRDTGPFEWPEAARAADLIVVAGDLSNGQFDIEFLCEPGKPLVFVPGNHDFWSNDQRDMFDVYRDMKQAAAGTNVHVLWDEEVQIDGVRILGTPLWTDFGGGNEELMRASMSHSNDYRYINARSWYTDPENLKVHEEHRGLFQHHNKPDLVESGAFTPVVAYSLHKKSLAFIEAKLDEPFEGPTILVTHMAPSYECLRLSGTVRDHHLDPKNWHRVGRDNSELARVAGYASDLSRMFERYRTELDLAVHGHIHASLDIVCGSTRVLANPRGRYSGPLTDGVECLFYGYTPRPEDIARSKARFEAFPYWGDNWEFEPDALFRIEDGLVPSLDAVVTRDEPRLRELLEEMRELEPFAAHEVATIRRSIHESAVARGEEFQNLLGRALATVAKALDVERNHHAWWQVFEALGFTVPRGPVVPRSLSDSDEEPDPRVGITAAISAMTHVLAELPAIPRAAELGRMRYQDRVNQAMDELTAQGLKPEWRPSAPRAMWRKLYFDLGSIIVEGDKPVAGAAVQRVDEIVNNKRMPRHAWVNVVPRTEEGNAFFPKASQKGAW